MERHGQVAFLPGGEINRQQPAFVPLSDGPLEFARREDLAEVQLLGQENLDAVDRPLLDVQQHAAFQRPLVLRQAEQRLHFRRVFAVNGAAGSLTANGIAAKRYV